MVVKGVVNVTGTPADAVFNVAGVGGAGGTIGVAGGTAGDSIVKGVGSESVESSSEIVGTAIFNALPTL